jgi:hypothetical protein
MHNNVAEIHHEPAFLRASFKSTLLFVILFGRLQHAFRECVKHAVAGTVANHKVIREGGDLFDVEKQDVFTLSVLQEVDDFMGKIESVQASPLWVATTKVVAMI